MNTHYLIWFLLFLFSCNSKQKESCRLKIDTNENDSKIISSNIDCIKWQDGFGLTHNPNKDSIWFKPVSFYLSKRECSALAKDFYYGKLKPSDDSITDQLLKLSITNNDELRPFYRWCLNKTILIQDGALGEHTGIPARKYVEKFPKEFFEYMDIDTSGNKYLDGLTLFCIVVFTKKMIIKSLKKL